MLSLWTANRRVLKSLACARHAGHWNVAGGCLTATLDINRQAVSFFLFGQKPEIDTFRIIEQEIGSVALMLCVGR